jgi:hypothetical protein
MLVAEKPTSEAIPVSFFWQIARQREFMMVAKWQTNVQLISSRPWFRIDRQTNQQPSTAQSQ